MAHSEQTRHGWNILDKDAAVLWREYSFGPALATTLVFRGAGDALIVVSPGNHLDAPALDELKDFGEVRALVATNGYHWLGQPHWRKHFPTARSFAPPTTIARIEKKMDAPGTIEPLEALEPLLANGTTIVDAPGQTRGGFTNAIAMIRTERGAYWYPADLIANMRALPKNPLFRALLSLTDSGPGLKVFRPGVWAGVKDKKTLRAWIEDELTRAMPDTIVPAHGAPISGQDVLAHTRALVAKI